MTRFRTARADGALGIFAMGKTIIHVDMDAFFAAVEARDNPELEAEKQVDFESD